MRRALWLYVLLLTGLFALEWGFAAYHALVLHAAYPFTTPLFSPAERFRDWTDLLPRVSHFGEPDMQTRAGLGLLYPYPLTSLFVILGFIRVFPNPLNAYVVFTVLTFSLATLAFWIHLRRAGADRLALFAVWITLLLGEPALFLLDRGNIEVFVWLLVLLGLVSFVRNWKYAAAVLFALAACMKIYPALFLLLFLPRKQYRAAALGVALTAALTVLALAAVGPTIPRAFHDMSGAAHLMRDRQIVTLDEVGLRFDHSLLGLVKHWILFFGLADHPEWMKVPPRFPRSVAWYSVLAPLTFAALYLGRIRRMPLLNQFMTLSVLSLLLPYVSYEYTLVQIDLVFAVFLLYLIQDGEAARVALPPARLAFAMACFAVTFAPLAYLALEHFQGQIKAVALLGLLFVGLDSPMPSTLFRDRVKQST
jgi:hypothetical protein